MKRSLLIAAGLALALPSPAAAKWIDHATITGPGLDGPVVPGGELLFDSTGFYEATVGTPTDLLSAVPTKQLGPRYTIVYSLPGPDVDRIRQDLYPYAAGGPVTYTKSGQASFYGRRTRGGWYVASRGLKQTLVSMGLPRAAPAASRDSTRRVWLLASAGAIFLGALPLVARRRRA
jgi:hypothetical protein